MRANRVSAYVFAVAASLAGCAGTGDVRYSGEVVVTSPELIEIEPGVQVIADANEPLFFADGFYWLYRDGYWLRSSTYQSGFIRVELSYVPQRIRVIDRPQTYVQYRRHMGRDYHARAGQRTNRSPQPPRGTTPYETQPAPVIPTQPTPVEPARPPQAYPPVNQGVPSTPGAETWQPGQPHSPDRPHAGVNPSPTQPQVTPPITSPKDVTGAPTPPHQVPPGQVRAPGQANRPATPPGQVNAPGQGNRPATPSQPPQVRPDDRGNSGNAPAQRPDDRGNRPDDRGNAPDDRSRGQQARDNNKGRGNETRDTSTSQGTASDRDDQATPPTPPSPPADHGAQGNKHDDKGNNGKNDDKKNNKKR